MFFWTAAIIYDTFVPIFQSVASDDINRVHRRVIRCTYSSGFISLRVSELIHQLRRNIHQRDGRDFLSTSTLEALAWIPSYSVVHHAINLNELSRKLELESPKFSLSSPSNWMLQPTGCFQTRTRDNRVTSSHQMRVHILAVRFYISLQCSRVSPLDKAGCKNLNYRLVSVRCTHAGVPGRGRNIRDP